MKKHLLFSLLAAATLLSSCAHHCSELPRAVLDLPPTEDNCRNSEGDFIELSDGRILFAYSKFLTGTGGDHDKCVIAARESRDRGLSWDDSDRILASNDEVEDGNVMSVSFLRLQDGRIALFYLKKVHSDQVPIATRIIMRTSSDEGASWSAEQDCTADLPLSYRVVNNSRVIRLGDGRVVIPVAEHGNKPGPGYGLVSAAQLYCICSDDDCATWHESERFYIDEDGSRVVTQEPGVMELSDGRVLMYIRTNTGYQWYAYSYDRAESWPEKVHAPFIGPLSPAKILRLSDGRLVNIWNNHEGLDDFLKADVRTPLTIALSQDEGLSWENARNVEEGFDPENKYRYFFCYTAALEVDDNILLAYCAFDGLKALRITVVPKSWLD